MFDIGATELLLVAIVALVVIGPKDLPVALRGVGRVIGQLRSITGQFRFSLDSMIREAEMEEQEKEWAKKNAEIMAEHPQDGQDQGDAPAAKAKAKPMPAADETADGDAPFDGDVAQGEVKPTDENEVDERQDDLFGDKS